MLWLGETIISKIKVWNLETKYRKLLAFYQKGSKNGYNLKEKIQNFNTSSQF